MKMWNQLILGMAVSAAATTMVFADDNDMATNEMMMPLTAQRFVNDAVWGNDQEIAAGKLAQDKSQNEAVKRFGERMIRDHSRLNNRVIAIANQEGLNYPSTNAFNFNAEELSTNNNTYSSNAGVEHPKGLPARALMQTSWDEKTNADMESFHNLGAMSSSEFDQTYANEMVMDHAATIAEFEDAATNLDDARLKEFAARTLPLLHEHYRMAQHMQKKVNETTSQ